MFKEKRTLDLRASSISELKTSNTIATERENILKSIAIYGKNASGKSNLLNALEFMADLVIESAKDKQSNEPIETDTFRLNTSTKDRASHFEVEFFTE